MEREYLHEHLEKTRTNRLIENDMQANQIIQKIEELKEKQEINQLIARTEIDRIKKWRDEANGELDRQIQKYRMLIHDYLARIGK